LASFEGGKTIWKLADAGGAASEHVVGTVHAKAELWALDDERGQFYLRAGDGVWRGSWRGADEPLQRLGGLPAAKGALHAAWIDARSGDLRALEMRKPSAAEARRMKTEPPDARPYWAVLWGMKGAGWVELMQRATSWGADGSVGPAVLDDQRHQRGRSARSLADTASCATLCDETAPLPKGIEAPDAEEWRALPGTAGRVQFGVALGDRWHVVGPVVLQQPGAAARVVVPTQGQALHLQLRNRRLLVSGDESAKATWVIDLDTAQVLTLAATPTLPVWVD
jgi:hypothetical protein